MSQTVRALKDEYKCQVADRCSCLSSECNDLTGALVNETVQRVVVAVRGVVDSTR